MDDPQYLELYCECGAILRGEAIPKRAKELIEEWKKKHNLPGHSLCDEKTWEKVFNEKMRK